MNKEKKTSFKELRTAVKANCVALKREYMLEGSIEVTSKVKKLVEEVKTQSFFQMTLNYVRLLSSATRHNNAYAS